MPSIAIIGASNNRRKFGNKAVRAYQHRGWTVFPVHPAQSRIEGLTVYKSIADVPRPIDRVALYLPPSVTFRVLPDIAAAGPGDVYFNPGTWSPEVIAKARVLGLNAIQSCAIVDIDLSPAQFP